jgi:Protein of unknown function (DUF3710)
VARHRDAVEAVANGHRVGVGVVVTQRVRPERSAATGPYDGDALDDPDGGSADPSSGEAGGECPAVDVSGTVDFGAIRIPLPAGGEVTVEPAGGGGTHAVHIALPHGRLSVSALAAPKSARLWPELAKEIEASLREGGARVRSFPGDWGRELHATTGTATSLFIGIDGPRWMLYGVATGPTTAAVALDQELRLMLRGTVVVRGRSPYPVRTVLPLTLPAHLTPAQLTPAESPPTAAEPAAQPPEPPPAEAPRSKPQPATASQVVEPRRADASQVKPRRADVPQAELHGAETRQPETPRPPQQSGSFPMPLSPSTGDRPMSAPPGPPTPGPGAQRPAMARMTSPWMQDPPPSEEPPRHGPPSDHPSSHHRPGPDGGPHQRRRPNGPADPNRSDPVRPVDPWPPAAGHPAREFANGAAFGPQDPPTTPLPVVLPPPSEVPTEQAQNGGAQNGDTSNAGAHGSWASNGGAHSGWAPNGDAYNGWDQSGGNHSGVARNDRARPARPEPLAPPARAAWSTDDVGTGPLPIVRPESALFDRPTRPPAVPLSVSAAELGGRASRPGAPGPRPASDLHRRTPSGQGRGSIPAANRPTPPVDGPGSAPAAADSATSALPWFTRADPAAQREPGPVTGPSLPDLGAHSGPPQPVARRPRLPGPVPRAPIEPSRAERPADPMPPIESALDLPPSEAHAAPGADLSPAEAQAAAGADLAPTAAEPAAGRAADPAADLFADVAADVPANPDVTGDPSAAADVEMPRRRRREDSPWPYAAPPATDDDPQAADAAVAGPDSVGWPYTAPAGRRRRADRRSWRPAASPAADLDGAAGARDPDPRDDAPRPAGPTAADLTSDRARIIEHGIVDRGMVEHGIVEHATTDGWPYTGTDSAPASGPSASGPPASGPSTSAPPAAPPPVPDAEPAVPASDLVHPIGDRSMPRVPGPRPGADRYQDRGAPPARSRRARRLAAEQADGSPQARTNGDAAASPLPHRHAPDLGRHAAPDAAEADLDTGPLPRLPVPGRDRPAGRHHRPG